MVVNSVFLMVVNIEKVRLIWWWNQPNGFFMVVNGDEHNDKKHLLMVDNAVFFHG